MRKRIAIVGRGTAGSQAAAHFTQHMPDCDVQWYFDSTIPTQSVGEGSVLSLPKAMLSNLGFSHLDLENVDGTYKAGVAKEGWGKTGKFFFHDFPPPSVSYHFNAVKLQDYILDKLKDKVDVIEGRVDAENVDADFVMNCSGKPSSYEEFHIPKYIPVNAVHVTQCYWDYPRFQYTLTIARPYGWVFGIPLKNRCAIGYLYNKDINTLEEVQEDVKEIFAKYNLTPSTNTNTFSFGNYYRKQNYTDRIAHNGNASFFLEPMEATSVGVMDHINRQAFDVWNGYTAVDTANLYYLHFMIETENIIMMHYFAGSIFKTPFWEFAQERGRLCMEIASKTDKFLNMHMISKDLSHIGQIDFKVPDYSVWWPGSFLQNIKGLGIEQEMNNLILGI
jgi:hypothetical protein